MARVRWAVIGALLTCVLPGARPARGDFAFPVCTAHGNQGEPAIAGSIVVWTDSRTDGGDIYGKDLATGIEFPACVAMHEQWSPAISGQIVVWTDLRDMLGTGSHIYGKDVSTGAEFPITVNPFQQQNPAISGPIVVWTDGLGFTDIYGCDLSTGARFPVCTAPGNQEFPAISGTVVVWQDYRNASAGGGADIYGCDLATGAEFPVCTAPEYQFAPAISGKIVVWTDQRNRPTTGRDIYGRDLETGREFPVCTAPGDQCSPAISGHRVIWLDRPDPHGNVYHLHARDLATGRETMISDSVSLGFSVDSGLAAISDNIVVWQQQTSSNSDLYAYRFDRCILSSGYVTPASGFAGTRFTWRVKYWNTDGVAPDQVWVALWFRDLKGPRWYRMWALDPADADYRDGAWYTFSRAWLPPGAYAYRFAAREGLEWRYWPKPAHTYASGPSVGLK